MQAKMDRLEPFLRRDPRGSVEGVTSQGTQRYSLHSWRICAATWLDRNVNGDVRRRETEICIMPVAISEDAATKAVAAISANRTDGETGGETMEFWRRDEVGDAKPVSTDLQDELAGAISFAHEYLSIHTRARDTPLSTQISRTAVYGTRLLISALESQVFAEAGVPHGRSLYAQDLHTELLGRASDDPPAPTEAQDHMRALKERGKALERLGDGSFLIEKEDCGDLVTLSILRPTIGAIGLWDYGTRWYPRANKSRFHQGRFSQATSFLDPYLGSSSVAQ